MKKTLIKAMGALLALTTAFTSFPVYADTSVFDTPSAISALNIFADEKLNITEQGGYNEGAYVCWEDSDYYSYAVYVEGNGISEQLDDFLIRRYNGYWRADAVGLAPGEYKLEVVPYDVEQKPVDTARAITDTLTVTAYDRSGVAFSSTSQYKGAGAYKEDGTLKDDAVVIYVTNDNAKTVTANINYDGKLTEVSGFQGIIDSLSKGTETRPIDIRIVGTIFADSMDSFSSSEEGLSVKGKNAYSNLQLTIEGIGSDSGIHGFGIHMRNAGNVELRNLAVMNCMDDSVSLDTNNCNIWVHNLDLFYGQPGSDADQVKGDGTIDLKANSTYITISYNHFFDNGKSSLCGMKSESDSSLVSYHHNWFDHSDSRHPRIRTISTHIYNNYFDGNSKYGVGVTMGSSAFVENNVFRNVVHPLMSSRQGSDALGNGTFSGESGGIIKSFNNIFDGGGVVYDQNSPASTGIDCYTVQSRDEQVPDSVVTVQGGTKYNNFDTNSTIDLNADKIDPMESVAAIVTALAGRVNGGDFKWTFIDAVDDSSSEIDNDLKNAIVNYNSSIISIGGNSDGQKTSTVSTQESTRNITSTEATTETTTEAIELTTFKVDCTPGYTPTDAVVTDADLSVVYVAEQDKWTLTDDSTVATATLNCAFDAVSSGKVITYGYVNVKVNAAKSGSKWAFLQILGTRSDGTKAEIVSFASDENKIMSARTVNDDGSYTYTAIPGLGALEKTRYNYTITIDLDSQSATLSINGCEVTVPIKAESVSSVFFQTAKSAADRDLLLSTPVVGTKSDASAKLSGDVNGDLIVNRADYALAAKFFAGYPVEINNDNCDVDANGSVTRADYAILSKYFAGKDVVLK